MGRALKNVDMLLQEKVAELKEQVSDGCLSLPHALSELSPSMGVQVANSGRDCPHRTQRAHMFIWNH